MRTLATAAAIGAALFVSSCGAPQPARYVVTHIGNSNAILTDSETGRTWILDINAANKEYWRPLSRISN